MIVGVSNNWYAGKDYTCNTPTGDFVRMLFNDTSGIYTSFLSKQKIFLFTMRWSIIPITKMSKLLKNACEQTGIAVSAGVIKKNTGSTNDSPKCCIYFINGVTKTKNIHKYCSFSKDDVITYFGDNPIGVQHKVVFVDYNNSILLDV